MNTRIASSLIALVAIVATAGASRAGALLRPKV